jgi:hypothetical protein
MQTARDSAMKRKISIVCCLLILVAAAAAAWADCAQISFPLADQDHRRSAPAHTHGHHSDSEHQHTHDSAIHCPTLDEFVPTATFSSTRTERAENTPIMHVDLLNLQVATDHFYSNQGPPGRFSVSRIPCYLSLSVLRI